MILAAMTAADEDALVCDYAETYHIYNYRGLPLRYAAALACGLREDSRIKLKMSGQKISVETFLQAAGVDALNTLVWFKTEDARRRRNRPKSILAILTQDKESMKPMAFSSPEAFEAKRKELTGGS